MSSKSFADLGVSNAVVSALSKQGFTEPFAIQKAVVGDVLDGRDILARSPTGSGKTLAFGIPLVDRIQAEARRPSALILAPTRELATQIVDEIRGIAHARALRITAVYGGVGLLKQAKEAERAHIIVATPGRLEDQLERGAFNLNNVKSLVIDEADRMLDMGFRPALDRIVALCPENRQTLFFSATLDGEAGKAARRYTNNAAFHEHGPTERSASTDVDHQFVDVTHDTRLDILVEHLKAPRELALVFVRTKHGADKLVKKLDGVGISALAMHGNKTQRQREQALSKFESFHVDTLVATDVAARGIDVSGISHVFNFDPPHDTDTYVHRVGRTGRAGSTGVGVTLVSPDQRKEINRMVGELGLDTGLGTRPSVQAGGFNRGERVGQPGEQYRPASQRRPAGRSREAGQAAREGGQGRDSRPSREGGQGRDSRPSREGGQSRDFRPNRDGAQSRDSRPNRDGGQSRDFRPNRDGGQSRDSRPNRDGHSSREAHPAGGKPGYGKPSSGKPSYGKPSGGKPAGGKPSYGKPKQGQQRDQSPAKSGAPRDRSR
jgi:superfamily II DNA/RNA helicase